MSTYCGVQDVYVWCRPHQIRLTGQPMKLCFLVRQARRRFVSNESQQSLGTSNDYSNSWRQLRCAKRAQLSSHWRIAAVQVAPFCLWIACDNIDVNFHRWVGRWLAFTNSWSYGDDVIWPVIASATFPEFRQDCSYCQCDLISNKEALDDAFAVRTIPVTANLNSDIDDTWIVRKHEWTKISGLGTIMVGFIYS